MNKKRLAILSLLIFLVIFIVVAFLTEWRYSNKIVSTETIILSGNQTLEIIDTKYVQRGDIILSGNAELIVRDSYFTQEGHGAQVRTLMANESSRVIFENSVLTTSSWIDWSFNDNSQLIYNRSSTRLGPWHAFGGNATLLAIGSAFGGTIYDNSKFMIKDSPSVFIEIYVYEDEVIDETGLVQGKVDKFVFPNDGEANISYSIMIENSKIANWGVGIGPRGTMMLKNSRNLNICMPIHAPYLNETVYFDNLRKDIIYDMRIIEYKGTRLVLENVSAKGWCLNAHNNNTVYVNDSDIDDINHNGGNGRLYYENVISNVAIATDNNYLEIRDSKIKGDVVAKGDSTIVLINTKVRGSIVEDDNGKVIMR